MAKDTSRRIQDALSPVARPTTGVGCLPCRRRENLFARYMLMAAVVVTVFSLSAATQASMYMCREKNGTMSFTNAPGSSNCSPYSLESRPIFRFQPSLSRGGDPSLYDLDIRRIARRYQLDPPLIKAIIAAESDFDPRAVSRRGAQGLMQLMPDTARELRVDNPFNPRENIDGGARYLRQMLDNFEGDLRLSLAAYNAGPGMVTRTGGIPPIPETLQYVDKVLKQYKTYKKQQAVSPLLVQE